MSNSFIVDAAQSSCMLARVRFSALGLTRTDRSASTEVNEQHGAIAGAARVVVNRLPGVMEFHKAITSVQVAARKTLVSYSMPYGDEETWRLLPMVNFMKVTNELAKHKADYETAIKNLIDNADQIREQALTNKGTFDIEIPTVEELSSAYRFEQDFIPVPDGTSFKGVPDGIQRVLTKALEKKVENAVVQAQVDTMERFVAPLQSFVERMVAYDNRVAQQAKGLDVGKTGTFKDSAVRNIADQVEVLGSFNILGDERLTELASQLSAVVAADAKALRTDDQLRASATEQARQALNALDGWLAPSTQQVAA